MNLFRLRGNGHDREGTCDRHAVRGAARWLSERRQSAPIFLGQVANLSGPDHYGKHAEQGISLALKQLTDDNLTEALQGRPLQVRHADTRGQLDAYEGEAVRLTSVNRVLGLIGGATPDEVARLDRGHVPLLATAGVRPPGVSDLVFAIGMRPVQQAFVLAQYAAVDMKLVDVVVVTDERREEFVNMADAFARHFADARPAQDKAAAPPVPLRFGKDARWDELAKLIAPTDVVRTVVFAGKARDWVELRRKLPAATPLIFAGDDGDTADLQGAPGNPAIHVATAFVPDAGAPRTQAFIAKYREAFKETPDVAAALGYEALQLYAEALKQSSPTVTVEKLTAALREVKDFPGLAGTLAMTPEQNVRRPLYVARLDDGVPRMVKRYEPDALP